MEILWTIIIGFVAGVIAKLMTPGKNEPRGFILTTLLGISQELSWPRIWARRSDGMDPMKVHDSSAPSSAPLSFSPSGA